MNSPFPRGTSPPANGRTRRGRKAPTPRGEDESRRAGSGAERGREKGRGAGERGTDKDDSLTPRLNNTGRKKGRKCLCNCKARMYLPVPPRRGCGRYSKGTHALPSPRSRSPAPARRAPTGSGAGPAGLRSLLPLLRLTALPQRRSSSSLTPGPAPPFFSPGLVQAPSSLLARLSSLPQPPGSAPAPGGAGLQLPRRSHHPRRRVLRCTAPSPPLPPPARPRHRPGGSPDDVHTRLPRSRPRETQRITGKSPWP